MIKYKLISLCKFNRVSYDYSTLQDSILSSPEIACQKTIQNDSQSGKQV